MLLAGGQGFEPWLPDPETGVLPLNYPPIFFHVHIYPIYWLASTF